MTRKMTDSEKIATLQLGWDLMMNYARAIAHLPIDEWLDALNKAEDVAPFIDPTLYRDYIYSHKGDVLKKIMRAALELKRTVEEVQPQLREMMEELNERDGSRL